IKDPARQSDGLGELLWTLFCALLARGNRECAKLNVTTGNATLSVSTAPPSIFWRKSRQPMEKVWNGKWSGRVRSKYGAEYEYMRSSTCSRSFMGARSLAVSAHSR